MEMKRNSRTARSIVLPCMRALAALMIIAPSLALAQERPAWTRSRVRGTPEPLPAYRVERAFPNLTFASPLDVVRLPGTERVIVVEQRARLFTIPHAETCAEPDLLADLKMFDREVV